jgi:gamma-glutamylcyclotransferase (GGCT)/AIG2-like uncharacterized protein YtfP
MCTTGQCHVNLRNHLFCYGTLMFAPIMQAVCGVVPPAMSARLEGYARYNVRGRPFPGIRLEPGGVVDGVLYQALSPAMLQQLDDYESDFYQRVAVVVRGNAGQSFSAFTYIVPPHARYRLSQQSWNESRFARYALPKYLRQLRHGCSVT